jgi:hypothetical protein
MKNRVKFSGSMALGCVLSVMAAIPVMWADAPPQKTDQNAQASPRTAFTYQGQLRDASGPTNGTFDVRFSLYTTQTSGPALQSVEYEGLALTNGLFHLQLDFGPAAQETSEGWLEIAVRPAGSTDSYAVLTPRQKLISMPYAILAQAESWSLIGVPVGFAGRVDADMATTDNRADHSATNAKMADGQAGKNLESLKGDVNPSEGSAVAAAPANTPNRLAKFDSTGRTFIDSIMFDNGANVGVGTTSPGALLDVAGTAQLRGAAGAAGLVVNSGGNVGIGTTSPGSKLDVAGTAQLRGAAGGIGLFVNSSGNVDVGNSTAARRLNVSGEALMATAVRTSVGMANIRLGADAVNDDIEIGSTNPSIRNVAFFNTGGGGFFMNVHAASFRTFSDARLKTNVTTLTHALEKINQMRGVSFDWNEASGFVGHAPSVHDIGVIAQEVEAVFPELVNTSSTDGYKAVDYSRLTAVLIEAVKELNAKNQALQAQSEQKDQAIQSLSARVAMLEQLVQQFIRAKE